MAIEIIKKNKINEKEACKMLMENPQTLYIYNVGDVRPSTRKENQYYCYVDFRMEDGTFFGISYSFNSKNGKFECGTSSKLYALMSGFLQLNPFTSNGLSFDAHDISETLLNHEFLASVKFESIGGRNYPYITCERVIE